MFYNILRRNWKVHYNLYKNIDKTKNDIFVTHANLKKMLFVL